MLGKFTGWLLLMVGWIAVFGFSAGAGESFKVGVCLSLSGGMKESGAAYLAGIKIRLDEHNANAGATGRRLELVVRDDQSNAERAAAIVEQLAVREGITAIIGPTSSAMAAAMRPNAIKHQVVVISPSATNPSISKNDDWIFRILFDDSFQGAALARYLVEKHGVKRAAAIINKRAYGQSVFDAFEKTITEMGGGIVAEEWYEWDPQQEKAFDFSATLEKVGKVKPDVVLLPNYSWEVAELLRQSLMQGVDLEFCGTDTWLNENVMLESGNNINGSYFIAGRSLDSQAKAMRHYAALYDQSTDPHSRPTSFLGYDALSLLIVALKNGESGAAIREGLYAIRDFPLASGSITIEKENGVSKAGNIYKVMMKNDNYTPVFVEEVKP